MPMPKAPVYENYRFVFAQYNVGLPGQNSDMNSESEAVRKQKPPYLHFGFRVFASDVRHAKMSLFGCHLVCHLYL